MNINLTQIGKNIERERKKAGLSQEQLASKINLKPGAIGKYERGLSKDIGLARIIEIADALGVELNILTSTPGNAIFTSAKDEQLREAQEEYVKETLDWDLLDSITKMIGEIQAEEGFRIKPNKLGGLIRLLYNEANTGLEVTKAKVIQLIKLAS